MSLKPRLIRILFTGIGFEEIATWTVKEKFLIKPHWAPLGESDGQIYPKWEV